MLGIQLIESDSRRIYNITKKKSFQIKQQF